MPDRKSSAIIKDILNCIDHIQNYTANFSFDDFSKNFMVVEACLYNIQIIGEAVSHLPVVTLPADRIERTKNGLSTRVLNTENFADGDAVQMHDGEGNLIAVGVFNQPENSAQPKVVLV